MGGLHYIFPFALRPFPVAPLPESHYPCGEDVMPDSCMLCSLFVTTLALFETVNPIQAKMQAYTDAVLDRLGHFPIPSVILDGEELAIRPVEELNAACRALGEDRDKLIDPIVGAFDAQWGDSLFVEHMRILARYQSWANLVDIDFSRLDAQQRSHGWNTLGSPNFPY